MLVYCPTSSSLIRRYHHNDTTTYTKDKIIIMASGYEAFLDDTNNGTAHNRLVDFKEEEKPAGIFEVLAKHQEEYFNMLSSRVDFVLDGYDNLFQMTNRSINDWKLRTEEMNRSISDWQKNVHDAMIANGLIKASRTLDYNW